MKKTELELKVVEAWKNIQKLLESEKALDNVAAIGASALGYMTFAKSDLGVQGALMGLISYKLATTREATLSQGAGLLGLATIGATWTQSQIVKPDVVPKGETRNNFWENTTKQKCGEGFMLEWDVLYGWHCIPIPRGPPS